MDRTRWLELEQTGSGLTEQEIAEGWHFCPEWDGMLIHPSDPEARVCFCRAAAALGESNA